MLDSEMPYLWLESVEEQPSPPRRKRHRVRYAGPTGGILTDPAEVEKRRRAQKAQRVARRRNRHG